MILLQRTDSDDKHFQKLVDELDNHLKILDGEDHAFFAALNRTDSLRHAVVAYSGSELVGCGALRPFSEDTMEVKRMYVVPERRGQGIGSAILKELEQWCIELGYRNSVLETSKSQHEAIMLYEKNGYKVIPNFGKYEKVTSSVCFEKKLLYKN